MTDESQIPPPSQPPAAPVISGGPGNALNERTYQEVEYLKRNLGPILVAALAEICIRRPADPMYICSTIQFSLHALLINRLVQI